MAHQIVLQHQFSQEMMGQYWSGKPQTNFQIYMKCFQKVAATAAKKIERNFLLTARLIPLDKHNLITAKAMA